MSDYSTIDVVVLAKTHEYIIFCTKDGTEYVAHSNDCEDFDSVVLLPNKEIIEISLTNDWLDTNGFDESDESDDDDDDE